MKNRLRDLQQSGITELIFFFIPVLITVICALLAMYFEDFEYLKKSIIASYLFLALFIWRICAFFYYKDSVFTHHKTKRLLDEIEELKIDEEVEEISERSYLKMRKPHHYLLLLNLTITTFCICLFIFILWKVQMNIKQMISLFAVLILSLFLGFLWTIYFDFKKELAYLLKIDKLQEEEQG